VPDIPPAGGVGMGRGAEYVVDVEGAAGGADGEGDAGRGGVTGEDGACGRGDVPEEGIGGRPGGVVEAAGRGGGAAGLAGGGVVGRGGGAAGRGGGAAGRTGGATGRATDAGGVVGCAGVVGRAAGLRALAAFLAGAAFLAAFLAVLRAAVFFLALALRVAALRAVPRAAVLRVAALRPPARFFALDLVFFLLPSATPARRMAVVAARFIFFKVAAAPALLFRLLDLAMIDLPRCLASHYGPNVHTTKHTHPPMANFIPRFRAVSALGQRCGCPAMPPVSGRQLPSR
jgi:hypothetical protein